MKITAVKLFFPVSSDTDNKLKAFVSIVFDDIFVIRDIKIIQGNSGNLFVAMPSKQRKDGTYKDIAHPLNKEMRCEIEKVILDDYCETLKNKDKMAEAVDG